MCRDTNATGVFQLTRCSSAVCRRKGAPHCDDDRIAILPEYVKCRAYMSVQRAQTVLGMCQKVQVSIPFRSATSIHLIPHTPSWLAAGRSVPMATHSLPAEALLTHTASEHGYKAFVLQGQINWSWGISAHTRELAGRIPPSVKQCSWCSMGCYRFAPLSLTLARYMFQLSYEKWHHGQSYLAMNDCCRTDFASSQCATSLQ